MTSLFIGNFEKYGTNSVTVKKVRNMKLLVVLHVISDHLVCQVNTHHETLIFREGLRNLHLLLLLPPAPPVDSSCP